MKWGKLNLSAQRVWYVALASVLLVAHSLGPALATEPSSTTFRVGFTQRMFSDLNENDARASIKAWGKALAKNRNLATEPEVLLFNDSQALLSALRGKAVDMVGVDSLEYELLDKNATLDPLFFVLMDHGYKEEYLLLAHRDGPVQSLGDLSGSHIKIHDTLRLCLAPLWLDIVLVEHGLKTRDFFSGRITQASKLSKVLLPVFFQQADACVVSRSGFETMTELNPQLGQKLVVLRSSAPVVPAVFAFRHDYFPPNKEDIIGALNTLHETAVGQQILMVFKSKQLTEHPKSSLMPTLQLIARHSRLMQGL